MDAALKNALWNAAYLQHWQYGAGKLTRGSGGGILLTNLWALHFYEAVDDLPERFSAALYEIRAKFMASEWASVYDFVEFVANWSQTGGSEFVGGCNAILDRHLSAYRFVGTKLAPITSDEEIAAVEQAIEIGGKFAPASAHIATALSHLSDRTSPDYRNAIKESISAVESTCKTIAGDDKATLGQVLKQIGLHPALEKGFSAIYGYASDTDGIRHAMMEESTLTSDDAKFFLGSCSAFVNYLIAKTSTADATSGL